MELRTCAAQRGVQHGRLQLVDRDDLVGAGGERGQVVLLAPGADRHHGTVRQVGGERRDNLRLVGHHQAVRRVVEQGAPRRGEIARMQGRDGHFVVGVERPFDEVARRAVGGDDQDAQRGQRRRDLRVECRDAFLGHPAPFPGLTCRAPQGRHRRGVT